MKLGKSTKFKSKREMRDTFTPGLRDRPRFSNNSSERKASGSSNTILLDDNESDTGIKIYLDDERPCPPGWTICRTIEEFRDQLEKDRDYLEQVTEISLDWYLGDRVRVTGFDAVKLLGHMIFDGHCAEAKYMPNLKRVNFHSSDKSMAKKMGHEFQEILDFAERSDIRLRFYPHPSR